jgi:transposase
MKRHEISDKIWTVIEPLIAKQGKAHDNRLFINAVVYQAKTGIQWRDLPERFGKWNSVYQRFHYGKGKSGSSGSKKAGRIRLPGSFKRRIEY